MSAQQGALFDLPTPRKATKERVQTHAHTCHHDRRTAGIYAGPFDCDDCNWAALDRAMRSRMGRKPLPPDTCSFCYAPLTSTPRRVQQRRAKGWRKPPDAVSVVRGTRWGNPYRVAECGRDEAIRRFEADLTAADRDEIRRDLGGRTLMCWCPPYEACHADVLLRIANGGAA